MKNYLAPLVLALCLIGTVGFGEVVQRKAKASNESEALSHLGKGQATNPSPKGKTEHSEPGKISPEIAKYFEPRIAAEKASLKAIEDSTKAKAEAAAKAEGDPTKRRTAALQILQDGADKMMVASKGDYRRWHDLEKRYDGLLRAIKENLADESTEPKVKETLQKMLAAIEKDGHLAGMVKDLDPEVVNPFKKGTRWHDKAGKYNSECDRIEESLEIVNTWWKWSAAKTK